MRVIVINTLDKLAADTARIPVKVNEGLAAVVRRNTERGNVAAQAIARGRSGPHGRLYYKRLTWEMVGPMTGEYGPPGVVVGNAVGAGWRHGANTDLEASLDVIRGPFLSDVGDVVDKAFW